MTKKMITKVIAVYMSSNKSLEDICKGFNISSNDTEYINYLVTKNHICRKSKKQKVVKKTWEPAPMSSEQISHYLKEYNERLDDELISSFDKILLRDEIRGYER